MDVPNAFIGHRVQPGVEEVANVLGAAASLWDDTIHWLETEEHVPDQEWKSSSPRYGWSLRMKAKDRTIIYLGPCKNCFRASFVLGDKAVAAALKAHLPKRVTDAILGARRYAEGTGVALIVRRASDLAPIRRLVEIKLAN
jgi:hypothetical protein